MKQVLKSAAIAAFAAATMTAWSDTLIYSGNQTIKDQGISVKAWGSGTISETDDAAYVGLTSLRISCRNFFQGGVLMFGKPAPLADKYDDKNNLIEIAFRTADASQTLGGNKGGMPGKGGTNIGSAGGGNKTGGGGTVSGGGNQFNPGGPMGGSMGPMGGKMGGSSSSTTATVLKKLRVVVETTDGLRSEAYVDVSSLVANTDGWRKLGLPLQAIRGLQRTNKTVKSIAISGDTSTTFYVGEIDLTNDSTPIYGEPNVRELNLAVGDEVTLRAYGYGGASILKYQWCFDSRNGFQVDAEGPVVKRVFRVPNDLNRDPNFKFYTITLRITDVFGLKKPYETTIKVTVNP